MIWETINHLFNPAEIIRFHRDNWENPNLIILDLMHLAIFAGIAVVAALVWFAI